MVMWVTEGTSLLLFPGKILGKKTKIIFPCYGIFNAIDMYLKL